MRRLGIVSVILFVVVGIPASAPAIVVNPTFTGFDASQQAAVNVAIDRWTTMLGGATSESISFVADSTQGLAGTTVQATDDGYRGRPTSATVKVNTAAYNWTTGAPAAGQYDGVRGMMHEIGHALGFSDAFWTNAQTQQPILNKFGDNVVTSGGTAFYDLNHNGTYNAGTDFRLATNDHAHAPDNSGDLMQPVAPLGQRYFPSYQHVGVLTDAYGYGVMLNGLGGTQGYGDVVMGRNDDGSSNNLNLPFSVNFFGHTYDKFFVNNNGNITFQNGLSQYTPDPFPIADQPMIAPYWGDVDTRPANGGQVFVASPDQDIAVMTWHDVGYFADHTDKTNDFQMVLRNRADISPGDFDIEFRYNRLEWTTGDVSGVGASGGLGGVPAQAGYDAGDRSHYLTLPGSGTAAVLNLDHTTNTPSNVDVDGLWVYEVRNGNPPGTAADNPLLPTVRANGWQFDFNIGNINNPVYIDPLVAIGYDYVVDSGPNFSSVLLPSVGDNLYDLYLWDNLTYSWLDSGICLTGGAQYSFASGGVNEFRILGIEPSAGLDPYDVTAFVTGLWFINPGIVTMRQVPVMFDTEAVPAPGALALLSIGLAGLNFARRKLT